ncbi:hypothetical protein [Halobacillus litoralis]|uniref:Uncharacterized protein n=1 Tax=Halobacillus litoralis TaxID=45668 RepID=A0A410MEH8_9BACI|nr:hypothetical protein [Halobacillus litoralis]QAS53065.1 hypothetical protein HLI_13135 [Halobacillus litoralis]
MTENEFEQFLSESFREGVYFRELRLSEKEVLSLKEHYPQASIQKTSEVNDAFSKSWYEINLMPIGKKSETLESIRNENTRLKRELESLRKLKK